MSPIHFNGKTYNDLAEMPVAEREMCEQLISVMMDEDGNGVPDIFEGDVVSNIIDVIKKSGYGDGKQVAALEEMPPAVRARLSKGIAKLYELGLISGMPDLPRDGHVPPSGTMPTWEDAEIRPSERVIQSQSVIQEDSSPRWLLAVGILAAAGICAVGVAFILLRGGF